MLWLLNDMRTNPEQKERWRALPTAEQWSKLTGFVRDLIAIDNPETRRRKLDQLALAQPQLARRLAASMGLKLAV